MNEVFELFAKLKLDQSEFNSGLSNAKGAATTAGEKVGSAFTNGLKTAAKVGSLALTAASGAIATFGKSAISAGLTFDAAMGQVAATAGKTEEALAKEVGVADGSFGHFEGTLRDFAQFMGANTAFTATEAAQALNYMALAGYETKDSMQMLPAVLDMAAAGSMNLALASDMITDTQKALGLEIDRTKIMVNEFAKAAASGNTSVSQLGEAFLTVGGLAKEANGGMITLKDGTIDTVDGVQMLEAAFTAMADAGIKGSEAGTHMRNILLKLANPTKKGQEALDAMGVSIYDASGQMKPLNQLFNELNTGLSQLSQQEKLSYLGEIFNARDTASAEALLAAASDGHWDQLAKTIKYAGDAASEMAETKLDNLQGDVVKWKSALEGVRIAISDKVVPDLRDFVKLGTEGLSKITEAIKAGDLSKAMDVVGDVIQKGLSLIFDKMDMLLEAGAKIVGSLAKGLIANLPKLVEAGKNLLVKFVDSIDTSTVASSMSGFVQNIVDILSDSQTIQKMSSVGTELIFALLEGWYQTEGVLADAAITLFDGLAKGMTEALPKALPKLIAAIRSLIQKLVDNAGQLIEIFKELAPVLIEAALQLISALGEGIVEALPELIPAIVDVIIFIGKELLSAQNLTTLLDAAVQIITALAWGLVNAIPQLINGISDVVQGIVNFLISPDNILRIIGAALQLIIALGTGLIEAIPTLLLQIPKVVLSMFEAFLDGIFSMDWLGIGIDIMKGILNGLWEGLKSIGSAIADIGKSIWNGFTGFFGIASPSKLMRDKVGKNIALGLAEGMEEGTKDVQAAMDDMMGAASGAISGDVTARTSDFDVKHTGTIRIEGVNNQGEFVAASEYVIEEIITNIMKREARLA